MARTRGAKSSSLRTAKGVCERSQVQVLFQNLLQSLRRRDQTFSSEAGATKAAGKAIFNKVRRSPLKKKPRVESSEPIDLTEQSPEKSQILHRFKLQCRHRFPRQFPPIPSPVPSPAPQEKAQEPQAPIPEPQIAAEAPLEEVIRRPMLPSPQSKETWIVELGHSILNLLRFSSIQSEARACPIFQLLRRYHMEHLLAPRDFFYPRVVTDFYQTMTTKEHWTQRRGVLWKLYKMSEGFFFGPHHLIMAALLYFEEKVHKKKLQRADCIPLLFPRLLCQVLEHLGYPSEPQQEKKRICREPPQDIPEGITLATPAIPRASPAAPAPSQPSTSAEPRMAIPISEYRELCRALETLTASQSNLAQELAAIKACQEQMLASQAQQAAILRQLQVHFDLPQAVEPSTDTPPEPHSQPSESHPPEPEAPADPPTEEADPSA
ncbi:hypothetical protein CK203_063655 [Vitis vinifera]|uniref:Uncharacterized protein n=1 Tax=Vitis vinifera TaxID=29760 RepID=A0A438G406_VITVI|nr:hypothetical protein CK203_063655 [Vitis vinifera]